MEHQYKERDGKTVVETTNERGQQSARATRALRAGCRRGGAGCKAQVEAALLRGARGAGGAARRRGCTGRRGRAAARGTKRDGAGHEARLRRARTTVWKKKFRFRLREISLIPC
ncbi:hypothetical protein IHE45_02G050000 [Dioscorea alata]|uniref:Uncharacterized protein n=1 Tax=Dioscorea alata TaxID=55571 RepID=A0ACB7WQL3_DIOAL|nr:hypothetical protein IHE45_02G050000 [Dioscorea alata]